MIIARIQILSKKVLELNSQKSVVSLCTSHLSRHQSAMNNVYRTYVLTFFKFKIKKDKKI